MWSLRSQRQSVLNGQFFQNGWIWLAIVGSVLLQVVILYLPSLQRAFAVVALSGLDWLVAGLVATSVLLVMEVVKRSGLLGI